MTMVAMAMATAATAMIRGGGDDNVSNNDSNGSEGDGSKDDGNDGDGGKDNDQGQW